MTSERVKTALLGLAAMVPALLLLGFAQGWDWMMRAAAIVGGFIVTVVAVSMFAAGLLAVIGAFLGDFDEGVSRDDR